MISWNAKYIMVFHFQVLKAVSSWYWLDCLIMRQIPSYISVWAPLFGNLQGSSGWTLEKIQVSFPLIDIFQRFTKADNTSFTNTDVFSTASPSRQRHCKALTFSLYLPHALLLLSASHTARSITIFDREKDSMSLLKDSSSALSIPLRFW